MAALTLADGRSVNAALGGRSFEGDDPVVVLIHGAGMDRTVWQMQTRFLAHHGYRAVAIDLPGHGGTDGEPCPSIGGYADWLADVVVGLDVGPVHVAGHSLGSFIGLEVAARRPDLVVSLMLLGTAASMPVHPVLLEAATNGDTLAGELMSGWAFAKAGKLGVHPSPGANMVGGTQALLATSAPGVLANDLAASGAYDGALEAAAKIQAPVTVILGRQDRMTPLKGAQSLLDALPDPHVVLIDDCGHMMTFERPDVVRTAMLEALAT